MAYIFSVVIIGLYLIFISRAAKQWLAVFWSKGLVFKSLYAVFLLLPGLFLHNMLSKERFIYYWDLAGYWKKAIFFSETFFDRPAAALHVLYDSINYDEYNLLPNLMLAPVNKVLGLTFANYIFSIYLVYLIPLSLIISSLFLRTVQIQNVWIKLGLPISCLLFTPLVIAMRFGMLDLIGLIPIFVVLQILVSQDFLAKRNYKTALVIGLLLTLLLFTRRWYIFWVVAYFPAVFIVNFSRAIILRNTRILQSSLTNLAISGIVVAGIVLLLFRPYFEMSVLKDYKDIYSAYRKSTLQEQIASVIYFYGKLIPILTIIGAVILLTYNSVSKKLMIFLLTSTVLIAILFLRINNFGTLHHYYLLAPLICVSYLLGAIVTKPPIKIPALVIFASVLALNYISVFIAPLSPDSKLYSTSGGRARVRHDLPEVNRMTGDLAHLQKQGHSIYVLASSHVLSDEIIKNSKLPDLYALPAVMETQHVDKRDRFPIELFLANYVIVTTPAQLHLLQEDQQVIYYLNEQILHGTLKHRYETIKRYNLDKGTTAFLKRRISALGVQEVAEISDFFRKKYPDYPYMYTIEEYMPRIKAAIHGGGHGKITFGERRLHINPGEETPSTVSFGLDDTKTYTISFHAGFANREEMSKTCDLNRDAEVFLSIFTDGELQDKAYLTHHHDSAFHINLANIKNLEFRVDKGENEIHCDWFELTDFKITQH